MQTHAPERREEEQATEMTRAGQAAQSATLERRLSAVSRAIAADEDTDHILHMIAQTALEAVGGLTCHVRVMAGADGETQARCTAAGAPTPDDARDDCRPSDALAQKAIDTGETQVLDAEEDAQGPLAAAPITVRVSHVGALCVGKAPGACFSGEDMAALQLLAAQAAVAVHHARLQEIAQRRAEHMELVAGQALDEEARARAVLDVATAVTEKTELHDILADVTRSACAEIGFERARIYLADHERHVLQGQLEACVGSEPAPISGEPISLRREDGSRLAEAALGAAPYMIEMVQEACEGGMREYGRLYVPLVTQRTLVGLIVADNPVSGEPVSPRRTRLLHALACLVGVAIERARVDKLRGALISSVSHELRAPLASIRAYNELVMEGDAGEVNDEQVMLLGRVERACKRLEGVIDDLMSLSKLRAGEVAVAPEPTDLDTLVHAVMDTMAPHARDAGVSLEFEHREPVPPVMTDAGRVEQVLTNLVDNAIKFNDEGGWVCIKLAQNGADAVISVADNGPGIPASYHDLIFEEFQHGTDERTRAREGAGLGLAIARRVMQVLGGRLWVESEPGEGSVFHLALPLQTARE